MPHDQRAVVDDRGQHAVAEAQRAREIGAHGEGLGQRPGARHALVASPGGVVEGAAQLGGVALAHGQRIAVVVEAVQRRLAGERRQRGGGRDAEVRREHLGELVHDRRRGPGLAGDRLAIDVRQHQIVLGGERELEERVAIAIARRDVAAAHGGAQLEAGLAIRRRERGLAEADGEDVRERQRSMRRDARDVDAVGQGLAAIALDLTEAAAGHGRGLGVVDDAAVEIELGEAGHRGADASQLVLRELVLAAEIRGGEIVEDLGPGAERGGVAAQPAGVGDERAREQREGGGGGLLVGGDLLGAIDPLLELGDQLGAGAGPGHERAEREALDALIPVERVLAGEVGAGVIGVVGAVDDAEGLGPRQPVVGIDAGVARLHRGVSHDAEQLGATEAPERQREQELHRDRGVAVAEGRHVEDVERDLVAREGRRDLRQVGLDDRRREQDARSGWR
jgi:hypothetical protein